MGEKKETFSALVEGTHGLVADTVTLDRPISSRLRREYPLFGDGFPLLKSSCPCCFSAEPWRPTGQWDVLGDMNTNWNSSARLPQSKPVEIFIAYDAAVCSD